MSAGGATTGRAALAVALAALLSAGAALAVAGLFGGWQLAPMLD